MTDKLYTEAYVHHLPFAVHINEIYFFSSSLLRISASKK
jgi:hypothetical protein